MDWKRIVEAATVRIENPEQPDAVHGQGVLVSGRIILTAAHVLNWDGHGGMVLGDFFPHSIETADGSKIVGDVLAVEPRCDIAALHALDGQSAPAACEAFEGFCETTVPVVVSRTRHEPFAEFRVHAFTHRREWVTGVAKACMVDAPTLSVIFDTPIQGGTSGSPILDDAGELVAILSNAGGVSSVSHDIVHEGGYWGSAPRPSECLLVYVTRQFTAVS